MLSNFTQEDGAQLFENPKFESNSRQIMIKSCVKLTTLSLAIYRRGSK